MRLGLVGTRPEDRVEGMLAMALAHSPGSETPFLRRILPGRFIEGPEGPIPVFGLDTTLGRREGGMVGRSAMIVDAERRRLGQAVSLESFEEIISAARRFNAVAALDLAFAHFKVPEDARLFAPMGRTHDAADAALLLMMRINGAKATGILTDGGFVVTAEGGTFVAKAPQLQAHAERLGLARGPVS